ncbi:hypothetical protein [Streptomyces longispororuber]|uniref:hypothetical protein n=1 Tax=Streptomyces longispororuber TaxID=68230 RepID=UPI0036FE1322
MSEIKRMSRVDENTYMWMVVEYVTGEADMDAPRRALRGAALGSPQLAARTLDALETALRRAKTFNPLREGETRREQKARIAPWRAQIQAAMGPLQDVVDDLAHIHAKDLAALSDESFAARWTAFILDEPPPEPMSVRVEALAFRSPRVAGRAAEVCRLMLEEPHRFLPTPPSGESGNARAQCVDTFRRRVEAEAKFLRYAVQYAEARHGRMPSEPNIRLQALKVLGERHVEELMGLLHEERRGELERAREARRERRALRRAARHGAR